MRFNPKARLDTSRVGDAGSGGGGGLGSGGGFRLPGGTTAGGGGIVAIIIAVVVFFLQQGGGGGGLPGLGSGALDASRFQGANSERYANCKTGEDANNSADCARVAVENSLTNFWSTELGNRYQPIGGIVTFTGGVDTQCGAATSDVGPFYCPTDATIYLDDTFFKDVLQGQLNGPAGAFVEPYVLAHEYGHHISNVLGFMSQVGRDTGPQSSGVRLELQADCYAGVWVNHATSTQDGGGGALIEELSQTDIDEAMAAAQAVGDDYIQKQSGGRVNEESWTHGSSEQRQRWFQTGYTTGSVDACDTFSAPSV